MPKAISLPSKETSANRILLLLPVALGIALIATNRWFTVFDDECAIIDRAAGNLMETVHLFLIGQGVHEHPPLFDLFLHGWLLLTGGAQNLLRLPSIMFYVLGIWVLANAAKHLEGIRAQNWTLLLVALWPYGFHFARAVAWYSLSFLLISLITWSYFRLLQQPSFANWACLFLASLFLVYANYFGWALLGCLALDLLLRKGSDVFLWWWQIIGTGLLLIAAYLPIFAAFLTEVHQGVRVNHSVLAYLANGIFNLFCMFVSESVAPWFWALGVIAGLAIVVCLLITLLESTPRARYFLLYLAALFTVMVVLGIISTRRLILLAPWLILPVAATLATVTKPFARRALLASIAIIGAIGWYGIFARNLYSAPRWIEPWKTVAVEAADTVQHGGAVISNSASFFFYLTYLLPDKNAATSTQFSGPQFSGLLPLSVSRSGAYDPDQWVEAGQPKRPTMLLIKGMHYGSSSAPTEAAEQALDRDCHLQNVSKILHDDGLKWKQRFAPADGELEWRVEIRTYACPEP